MKTKIYETDDSWGDPSVTGTKEEILKICWDNLLVWWRESEAYEDWFENGDTPEDEARDAWIDAMFGRTTTRLD